MKFDNIIIGGGHSGLAKGLELLEKGESCLAVCRGSSSRRFREEGYDWKKTCLEFEHRGGVLLRGGSVLGGDIDADGKLQYVYIENHGQERFIADKYFLCTGSFFSGGLVSTREKIYEPIFGLDVEYDRDSTKWVSRDFFDEQPFMKFGVFVDEAGRALLGGRPVVNLFPLGSIISRR